MDGGTWAADRPILIGGCDTIPKLFAHRCRLKGEAIAHREKDLGIWRAFTWSDYYDAARAIGLGLIEQGMRRGDPVALLSEDRREWLYVDMGVVCAGGITNGVYTTDSAEQLAYLVNDSGARFLFVENDEQLDKWLEARDRMPGLELVVVPSDWQVWMTGGGLVNVTGGSLRATVRAWADQGDGLDRFGGERGAFAGQPATLWVHGERRSLWIHSRRRLVQIDIRGGTPEERATLEQVLAPTVAPTLAKRD